MPERIRPGDLLAGRYRVAELLAEAGGGRFWRAEDLILHRHVAVHVLASADARAATLLDAARRSTTVHDPRILKVLDASQNGSLTYVVNEWGEGTSLDLVLERDGPLPPRRAAWITAEVASTLASAHANGLAHGRLGPENVLIDTHGAVRIIGFAVEAAMQGLPPGRIETDLTDLVAILYAGLTARWAGETSSRLRAAPRWGEHILRPRKVRAGIPRDLDLICDHRFNGPVNGGHVRWAYNLDTARGLSEALRSFVGNPTGLAIPESGELTIATPLNLLEHPDFSRPHASGPVITGGAGDNGKVVDAVVHEDPPAQSAVADQDSDQDPAVSTEPGTAPPAPAPVGASPEDGVEPPLADEPTFDPHDLPTQAGMPVFTDDGSVGWIADHAETPPPPPPFEAPAERPLFAPEPAPGEPVRRARPGVTVEPAPAPWGHDNSGNHNSGNHTSGTVRPVSGSMPGIFSTGSGYIGAVLDEDQEEVPVPGRRSMRVAAVLALGLIALLAFLALRSVLADNERIEPTSADEVPATATRVDLTTLAITGVRDFDPLGENGEYPELIGRLIDGDPTTSWRTATYRQQLGPGGLKPGVGFYADLGQSVPVAEVRVEFTGGQTAAQVFVTDQRPTTIEGLTPAGELNGAGTVTATVEGTARYVLVWIRTLPEVDGGFRAEVGEIEVLG